MNPKKQNSFWRYYSEEEVQKRADKKGEEYKKYKERMIKLASKSKPIAFTGRQGSGNYSSESSVTSDEEWDSDDFEDAQELGTKKLESSATKNSNCTS